MAPFLIGPVYGDVNGVVIVTRRHFGGILNSNKDWVKISEIENVILPRLFADRAFQLVHNSTHGSSQSCV